MRTAGWERWAPLSGIIFVGLTVPTLFLPPKSPPGAGAPAAEWASFVQDHRSALLVSVCLSGLAVVAFMFFLGSLATRLRAAGQELLAVVALGAGLVTAAVWYVWLSFEGVLAWTSAEGLDPTVVKTLLAAADFAFPFPVAALVVASSLAAWRSATWPTWLSCVGARRRALGRGRRPGYGKGWILCTDQWCSSDRLGVLFPLGTRREHLPAAEAATRTHSRRIENRGKPVSDTVRCQVSFATKLKLFLHRG